MNRKILLTSFQTWMPHQASNSSDDLFEEISKLEIISPTLLFLRQLPVDVCAAASLVIAKIAELQPDSIICCGMAEAHSKLTVESCASCKSDSTLRTSTIFNTSNYRSDDFLRTSVDLEKLLSGLSYTEISHDAGKFVCEGLYYQVLNYLQTHQLNIPCIFVHVPILTTDNLSRIVTDFQLIIEAV